MDELYNTISNTNINSNNNLNDNISIPWVEKYRPSSFSKIVLDPFNKKIMDNILKENHFPNLLLYGPPGTGKTTTIINLINEYQKIYNQKGKGLIIHLNASDERGIDIIRNQINSFVNSNGLFNTGIKFVILDEVDYMTKNAQQALKYLLQSYNNNVRFCLICNYISRIDDSLQHEFLKLRFNQLPEEEIIIFLEKINIMEKLNFNITVIRNIQKLFKSDIRSMINYMQTNQNSIGDINVIDNDVWYDLFNYIIDKNNNSSILNESQTNSKISKINKHNDIINYFNTISIKYNIEMKNIIKDFINYIVRYKKYVCNENFFNFVEFIMHTQDINMNYLLNYIISRFQILLY
jgi:replication factor C subunit 3/5